MKLILITIYSPPLHHDRVAIRLSRDWYRQVKTQIYLVLKQASRKFIPALKIQADLSIGIRQLGFLALLN